MAWPRRDVLRWVIPRQRAIQALQSNIDLDQLQDQDMNYEEVKLICLVAGDRASDEDVQNQAAVFWCMAKMVDPPAE